MWAKANKALYLRVEPAWTVATMPPLWVRSKNTIQMAATYTLDLRKSEEELLAAMDRKQRYYIRWGQSHGVSVEREEGGELAPFYEIYQQTAKRAGFGIHSREYYERLLVELGDSNRLYYSYFEGRPISFSWVATAGKSAVELYGGMTPLGGKMNANYAVKWRVIEDLKAQGYELYDFNGRLEGGVSKFKKSFAPDETNWIGTWDYPVNKAGYLAWRTLWPVAKPVGRVVRRIVKR
jgi:lipid II:glycine glycyltransferase (peptidoglycan interpeptide bridge formation enzyme)